MPKNEFDDEPTPIGSTPIENIERRAKSTATDARTTLATVTIVRDELRSAISRDETEHAKLHSRLDAIGEKVGEVSEMAAVANAKLDLLVDDIRFTKKAVAHRQRVTVETEAVAERVQIEDAADSRKQRRARNVKILAIVASALGTGGVLATALATALGKC